MKVSDIAFSMTSDERDVIRGIQAVGKESGKLRDQIASLVTQSKEAGVADQQLSQTRLAALNPILAKQKELRIAGDELKKQLADGKISADEYKTAFDGLSKESNGLRMKLQQLQAQVAEDSADLKKAGTIIGQTEDKTAKYTRAVAELDRMKAKGILTSKQHAAAIQAETDKLNGIGDGADKSGGFIGSLTGKMAGFVAGLGSASAVISLIKQEYDALLERQGKSKDANVNLAGEQEALLMNLGDADPKQVTDQIRDLSKREQIKEVDVTRAVNEAMAARADLSVEDVMEGVSTAAKVRKFAPSELAGLSSAAIDTRKQTGLGTEESMGFLMQLQAQSRTKSLKGLAENFTPAVGSVMQLGADRQTAGGLLAALSHGMGDSTGAESKTSAISLAKQLREYSQRRNPEIEAKAEQLSSTHSAEQAALKADYDKQAIALQANRTLPTEQKAEMRRQMAVEEKRRKDELKKQQDQQMETLQASAPAIPIGQVIERMQKDKSYRDEFLKGKDQGGFGATFEAKALPAVESLLSGGTQAKQYANAKQALNSDPKQTFEKAIANRDLPAMNLAANDQAFGNTADQLKLADTKGAQSSIIRDRLREIRDSMGKTAISSNLDTAISDLTSGGEQTPAMAVQRLEGLRAGLRPKKLSVLDSVKKEDDYDFNVKADRERFNAVSSERYGKTAEGKQEALLTALIDEIKGMRDDQKDGKHAGVVANRATPEGRP
jgi:hypothetical protein